MNKTDESKNSHPLSMLNWEIDIDITIFGKKEKEKYNYLSNIFAGKIKFWDNNKIDNKNNENYFSIIIWKNWVWKSAFIEYLIEVFKKGAGNLYKSNEIMYITFSAFDNINYQDKIKNFKYNWLKNKASAIMSPSVYNANKLKLLHFLDDSKLDNENNILSYIKFLYWYDNKWLDLFFEINPRFLTDINEDTIRNIGLDKIDKFPEWIDRLEEILIEKMIKSKNNFKFNNLSEFDIVLLPIFAIFYNKLINEKEINIKKLTEVYHSVIKLPLIKKVIRNITSIKFNHSQNDKIDLYKNNPESLFVFLTLINWIRDRNSMTQAVNLDFFYKIKDDVNNSFNIKLNSNWSNDWLKGLKYSSSWELVLLFNILHLWDFNWHEWKKIILIDEPEISLHPQWQRDYLEKLNKWLEILWFINCFFIIVTHSPLIVLWSQDKKVKNENEFENKYNVDVYWFKKDNNWKTFSEKLDYISADSIDEVLSDDFWVRIISKTQELNINERYFNLLKKIKSENSKEK